MFLCFRLRLNNLFSQIEKEFEGVYAENLACKLFSYHKILIFCQLCSSRLFFSSISSNNNTKILGFTFI